MGFDPDASYPTCEVSIGRGDRLVLYTDGVVEVANTADEFFGQEGLRTFVAANSDLSTDGFADALLSHLQRRSGRSRPGPAFEDDLTFAVVDVLV